MILTVQANPILGRSCCATSGKMMPPVAPPDAAHAMATTRFLEKYVATKEIVGQKTSPSPNPLQIPCAKRICQYCVEIDVMKTATT